MKKFLTILPAILAVVIIQAQDYRGKTHQQTAEDRLNELYCSGLFKTSDGTILDVAADPGAKAYFNILDWLPGRVAGVQVITTRNGVRIPLIRGGIPALYVDEIQVSYNLLSSLNVNDIGIIKVIKTPFLGGFNGGSGAIAIYTIVEEEEEE